MIEKPGIEISELGGPKIKINNLDIQTLGGRGVEYAVHQAEGPTLVKECANLGGCQVGKANITKGYYPP